MMPHSPSAPSAKPFALTPRIVRLDADPQNYVLTAVFDTGETKCFNVEPLITKGVFRQLRSREAFLSVRIDELGGVVWDAGPDLCRDTIYFAGTPAPGTI